MVGMGTPIQTLPMSASHLKEVDIIGIFRYANTYPTGIKLISAGVLPSLDNMITHRSVSSHLKSQAVLTTK
jgi:L-iditol 2-dehydrogenase